MSESDNNIYIFAGSDDSESPAKIRRGLDDSVRSGASGLVSSVAIDLLKENMRRFLTGLDEILSASPSEVAGLSVDEVEIRAQIDGSGKIGIAGIGGQLAAQGGMKIVLRRKKS